MQWEGQEVIPPSLVKKIIQIHRKTNFTKVLLFASQRWHILCLWHIFCWAFDFSYAFPPVFMTHTHFTYSVCLLLNDPILHHSSTSTGPMQWCKTLGYHYSDTNSTGFKTGEAQPGNLLQCLQTLQNSLLLQHCFTRHQSLLHSLSKASQFYSDWYWSCLTVLIWTKMPVETDIDTNTIARKAEFSWDWFFKTEGVNQSLS